MGRIILRVLRPAVLALSLASPLLVLAGGAVPGWPTVHPLFLVPAVMLAWAAVDSIWQARARPGSGGGAGWKSYRERMKLLQDVMGLDRKGF